MSSGFQVGLFIVLRLLAAAALGLLLGWPLGSLWAGLSLACGAYLCWQLITLFRVEWWVRHRGFAEPPEIGGPWGEVITQIVRLHRRKRFHKQRFVQLFRQIQRSTAALPDGVVILNDQREIVWFNRMAAQLLFLRRPADLGLRIDNLVRQPDFVRYLNSGQFVNPIIVRGGKGDHLYLSLQVVPYGEGQQLLLVRDVSHQMRLEAMRKDFVANASHELRSPLTVISGYLETLSQDPMLDLDLQGPIGEMRRQSERMTTIITELLELSRLEAAQELLRWLRCCARTCWHGLNTRSTCACGLIRIRCSPAMSRKSTRHSPTWWTTPPNTHRAAVRSKSAGRSMPKAAISRSRTAASASMRTTSRG